LESAGAGQSIHQSLIDTVFMGPTQTAQTAELGIVIPCYNEQEVLPELFARLEAYVEQRSGSTKLLFVDDGSHDDTWAMLQAFSDQHEYAAALQLSRNFGHQTAVSAGLANVEGDVVGIIDADLQDPPELFDDMLAKWEEGYEVVYAIRQQRKENPILRATYYFFYRLLRKIASVDIAVDSGDFALMDRSVVDWINRLGEHNRFIRGLRGWLGFKQVGVPYERQARAAGEPKYSLSKLFKLAMDGLISFSSLPLKISGWLGLAAALLGFLYLVVEFIKMIYFQRPPAGWPSLIAVVTFFGGVQLIILGIIGQYVGRIFDEVKGRPIFVSSGKSGWLKDREISQPGSND
jgi:glycosyltransferase involved in cell wall biosynthesis